MIVQLRLSILGFIRKHRGRFARLIAGLLTAMFFIVRLPVWLARTLRPARRAEAATKLQAYAMGIVYALFGGANSLNKAR